MPDEEEKVYDFRSIKCGGWFGSKMTSRRHGNWTNFRDTDTGEQINMPEKIDYNKKYNPPGKRSKTELKHVKATNPLKIAVRYVPAQTIQEIARNAVTGPSLANLPPERTVNVMRPPIREKVPLDKPKVSTRRNSNESLKSTESKANSDGVADARFPSIVLNTCDFSFVKFPQVPKIVNKRKGTDPERFPFRISTLFLEELYNMEEERKRKYKTGRDAPRRTFIKTSGTV